MTPIKMDQGDVYVSRVRRLRCIDCGKPATHTVVLDVRNAGFEFEVMPKGFCKRCAEEMAQRIRLALPKASKGLRFRRKIK